MQVTANRPPATYTVELSDEEATLLVELLLRRSSWRDNAPYGCSAEGMFDALIVAGVQRATTYSLTPSDDY
jgi:hypothetical protein